MNKLIISLLISFIAIQTGYCAILDKEINILNLKSNNMYMLNVDSSVQDINISNKDIVNITPITSISNNKKQLFIEANNDGVCDVILTTDSNNYKIRFISGPVFQDNVKELVEIDVPSVYEDGSK